MLRCAIVIAEMAKQNPDVKSKSTPDDTIQGQVSVASAREVKPLGEHVKNAEDVTLDKTNKQFVAAKSQESKKKKIIFAGAVAQVVSLIVAPLAVVMVEKYAPKQVEKMQSKLATIFEKHHERILPAIRRPWESALTETELAQWKGATPKQKSTELAESFVSSLMQAGANILVTLGARELLDRVLNINAGGKLVLKSQMIDTAVALGATVALPVVAPKFSRDARQKLAGQLDKSEWFKHQFGEKAPKRYALNAVSFAAPDFLGFATGIGYMLREVERKEQQEQGEETSQGLG